MEQTIKVKLQPLPFVTDPMESLDPGGSNATRIGNVVGAKKKLKEGQRQSYGPDGDPFHL